MKESREENNSILDTRSKPSRSFQTDVVDGIYKIHTSEQIHELTTDFCKYFLTTSIEDGSEYFAIVFEKQFVPSIDTMYTLKSNSFKNLNKLITYSIVKLSNSKTTHLVAIVQKYDVNNNLGRYIERNGPLSLEQINKKLIPHLTELLSECENNNISCININPFNIIIEDENNFILKEFISSYSNFSQIPAYLAPEIAECTEAGRQNIGVASDVYALAMCVFYCLTGKQPWTDYESIYKYNEDRFELNTFRLLTNKRKLGENIKIFLKGTLHDNAMYRWKIRNIFEWLVGNAPKVSFFENNNENVTSISFKTGNYSNLKSIAYALFRNWDDSLVFLQDDKLLKWFKRQPEISDNSESIQNLIGSEKSLRNPFLFKSNDRNNRLAKLLILIDPTGSVRFNEIATSTISLPKVFHYLLIKNKRLQAEQLIIILREKYWRVSKTKPSACNIQEENESLFENTISIYSANSPIFGIERLMYSLNPQAACLSPLLINDYVTDLPDLLSCLDKNASEFPDKFVIDRHVIAFIAAKLNITEEKEIKMLTNFPKFSDHPLMYGLGMLNLAQKAVPEIKLQNLCNALSTKIVELFEEYLHNINFKKQITLSLNEISKSGDLSQIVTVLSDQKPFIDDYNGYYRACKDVQNLKKQIEYLSFGDKIFENALVLGQKLTVLMSYILCLIVTVILIV